MPDTFDPRTCGGGPACVHALRAEYEIRISQRLAARLVALARRGLQVSLALLEAASPGSELEARMLDDGWSACETPADAAALIGDWGRAIVEDDVLKIVAPDEVDEPAVPTALAVARPATAPARREDAPWSEARLDEAARTFFDAEDPTELVEKLRLLFRAALSAGLDPTPLLVLALSRNKRALRLETGALIRQHLDRETGRAIEDLQGDDEARLRDAIHVLARTPEGAPLAPLVLPALTPVLSDLRALRQLIPLLAHAIHLVPHDPDVAEPFLDGLLDQLTALEAPERFTLSRLLIRLQDRWPALPELLFRRLGATVDVQVQAFYGNLLARMRLEDDLRERLTRALVELFGRQGHDVALAERLKVTFLYLGARPLELLTLAARTAGNEMQRSYLVDLWTSYLNGDHPHPPVKMLAEFLAAEIAARNRAALLSMIRSPESTSGRVDLLALPQLREHVLTREWLRDAVIAVLLEEAVHLEDPDDVAAMTFLARLGREAVETAFERAREEAALDSRAAPYRFRVFAFTASRQDASPWLSDMTVAALGWPFLRRLDLPVTLVGLGLLSRVPGIAEDAQMEILERVLPDEGDIRYPAAHVAAALDMYRGPTTPASVKEAIEARLERVVAAPTPPRGLLVAVLDALDALMEGDAPPLRVDPIAVTLARVVLQKSRETSLHNLLADALRDETEGHGVRVPEPWSKEERDHALVILGKVAAHAGVSERLHRMITARLAGFTEDWLEAHERGQNLYLHRDTPLWQIMVDVVERRPSEHAVEALVRVGLRALEVQRHAPANLALERREEIQRLLGRLVWLAPQEPVAVRGSLELDIPKTALTTLTHLAMRDNDNARRVLEEVEPHVPERLRPQLEGFLAFQRRRGDGS